MRKLSEQLGQIVVALASIALLACSIIVFKGPLDGFFYNVAVKECDIGQNVLDGISSGGSISGLEDLESKYEFEYYRTLRDAIEGIDRIPDKITAVAGAYCDEGKRYVVLFENIDLTSQIQVSEDVVINLFGKTVSCGDSVTFVIRAGNVVIDGSCSESKVVSSGTVFLVDGGSLEVHGGTYESHTAGTGASNSPAGAITVSAGSTLMFCDASVYAEDCSMGTVAGILGEKDSTIIANGCTIHARSSGSLETAGIRSSGSVRLTDCSVVGFSDYTANAAGTAYASNSRGIYCEGDLELYDCYVWGAHAGVTTKGGLTIDGGTYEGYGHGGLYISSTAKDVSIKNAKIYWAEMKNGYVADDVAGTNGAGLYIGGASNITVYMDHCEIYGTLYGVVLRSSGGEKNNNVYISNSSVEGSRYGFRIQRSQATTLLVYKGVGNTFCSPAIDYSANLIETEDSYA